MTCCPPAPQTRTAGCSRELHCVDQKQHNIPEVQRSQVSPECVETLISICKHTVLLCAIISDVCLPSSPRRNILPHINSSYLKRCEFNRATDPDCPIFRLKHIVSEAGEEFQDIAVKVRPSFDITPTKSVIFSSVVIPSFISCL